MKDLPHQTRQMNRKAIREERQKRDEPLSYDTKSYDEEYRKTPNKSQKKKLIKEAKKLEKMEQVSHPKTSEEREKMYRRTVPVIRRRSHRTFTKK